MRVFHKCFNCKHEIENLLCGVGWKSIVEHIPFICPKCDSKMKLLKE